MGQYIRLDKIKGSAHIETVVHTADLKNGQFVELGVADEALGGEAMGITPTAEGGAPEALITTVHLGYGHPDFDETLAVTKAGKAGRAHIIEKGDFVSFLDDIAGGVGALVVGDNVAVGANGLGIKKADEVAGDVVIGKVVRLDFMPNVGELVVVRFK